MALVAAAACLQIGVDTLNCGARLIDCGVQSQALSRLAATGRSVPCRIGIRRGCPSRIRVCGGETPCEWLPMHPVAACMASQYAGWELMARSFLRWALGRCGPQRSRAIIRDINHRESADRCVGVLETGKIPPDSVCVDIAAKCGISPDRLTLCVARTSSPAGTVQIVARSLETALHKLHELGFDLYRVNAGHGWAPLPPLVWIKTIWQRSAGLTTRFCTAVLSTLAEGDDASLDAIGPRVPSSSSPDFGRPFAEIFRPVRPRFLPYRSAALQPSSGHVPQPRYGPPFHFRPARQKY